MKKIYTYSILIILVLAAVFMLRSKKEDVIVDVGNGAAKANLIVLDTPRPNEAISSPLVVKGKARGTWYFEASFPIRILDANKNVLVAIPAQAQSEWMTTEFVPFETTISFPAPTTKTGTLVLQKDNPSGLPEHEDALIIPIVFKP